MIETRTRRRTLHAQTRGLHRTHRPFAGQKRVDASRGFLSFRDGVDDFAATVRAVAPGEDVLAPTCDENLVFRDLTVHHQFRFEMLTKEPSILFLDHSVS